VQQFQCGPNFRKRHPILFRQALTYTQAGTGFSGRLIEKDYFCSVLLDHLAGTEAGLIFKTETGLQNRSLEQRQKTITY
jgi:hypothetical protein